ncbi:MAG: BrnT family toxin [Gammaproteobacteria bacterium]|nr:BrnT family toxin [Gammaproteobacteria bacterium]
MIIEYDHNKRNITLAERGLDFAHCDQLFDAPHIDIIDNRFKYGEQRVITYGFMDEREVVVVWTQRGEKRRIISMRKANEREQKTFYQQLG